jgi:hypothetical protein
MNDFYVGQQVVCIDDTFKHVSIDQLIRKGQIYTIRWVGMYSHYIDGEFSGSSSRKSIAATTTARRVTARPTCHTGPRGSGRW